MLKNIRYAEFGKILFDYKDTTIAIREPIDVLLVGADPKLAEAWILRRYGYLLS